MAKGGAEVTLLHSNRYIFITDTQAQLTEVGFLNGACI